MKKILVLENQYPADLGVDIKLAGHVHRVKGGSSAFQIPSTGDRVIQVEVQGIE